jgi:hypothetical protein
MPDSHSSAPARATALRRLAASWNRTDWFELGALALLNIIAKGFWRCATAPVACSGLTGMLARTTCATAVGETSAATASAHALMALAMIAMFWSWGMVLAPIVDVLVFTAGVLYFAYLGLFTTRVAHAAYHSVMMGSMVLMASA